MKLRRTHSARLVEHRDGSILLGADGLTRRFDAESAPLLRAVLVFLSHPHTEPEVRAHIEELSGGPLENPAVLDELLALLRTSGAIAPEKSQGPERSPPARRARLVLGISGAVNSMHTPALVDRLMAAGFDVWPVLTPIARRFVRAASLEALTHHRVHRSLWDGRVGEPAPHIALAQWADAVLVCPASATTLGRMAHGSFDELVAAVAQTALARVPVIVVPSMNPMMYSAPSVQRSIELLRDDGMYVVLPGMGHEVAEAPDARVPVLGPAPSFESVVALLQAVLHSRVGPPPPESLVDRTKGPEAAHWNALYASEDPTVRVWESDEVDPAALAAITAHCAPPGPVLDAGCGSGLVSAALATRGYNVTAIDLSSNAINAAIDRWQRAKGDAPAGDVKALWGDILNVPSHAERFASVHDRACLHVLPRALHKRYADEVHRVLAPGGLLVLTVHDATDPRAQSLGTQGYTPETLRAWAEPHFTVRSIESAPFHGPAGLPPPRALRALLVAR